MKHQESTKKYLKADLMLEHRLENEHRQASFQSFVDKGMEELLGRFFHTHGVEVHHAIVALLSSHMIHRSINVKFVIYLRVIWIMQ